MLFMVKKTATKRGIQLVVTDVEPKKTFLVTAFFSTRSEVRTILLLLLIVHFI